MSQSMEDFIKESTTLELAVKLSNLEFEIKKFQEMVDKLNDKVHNLEKTVKYLVPHYR